MHARIRSLDSIEHPDWTDFEQYEAPDPYDEFGWFHVTAAATDTEGGNDFQVCVATRAAIGRIVQRGDLPGIIVDRYDAASVQRAIYDRVESVVGEDWDHVVDQLRQFMLWEYDDMAG